MIIQYNFIIFPFSCSLFFLEEYYYMFVCFV